MIIMSVSVNLWSVHKIGVDVGSFVAMLCLCFYQLESEINTLRLVLDAKVRQANDLKHRLGITPMAELKRDIQHGVETIRSSESSVLTHFACTGNQVHFQISY